MLHRRVHPWAIAHLATLALEALNAESERDEAAGQKKH